MRAGVELPFGRCALLFDLRKRAVRLVCCAVCTSGQFSIAFDLLFAAHITSLHDWVVGLARQRNEKKNV